MHTDILPGTDDQASLISLGTAPYGTGVDAETAFRLMDAYVEQGGNLLDTAHVYGAWAEGGEGASEKVIGRWLRERGCRDDVLIATKGAHPVLETGGSRMSRHWIRAHLSQSMDRLGIQQVDFYWLHRDDPEVPVGEIVSWMNDLVEERLIRAFGHSNWTIARQQEAAAWARKHGLVPFAASQVAWSLARPTSEAEGGMCYVDRPRLAWHQETRLPVMAYSSQAKGFFQDKYDRDGTDDDARENVLERYGSEENYRRRDAAKELAAERGATPNQVALAWLLSHEFPVFGIVGPKTVEQVRDACGAADLVLTPEQVAHLDEPDEDD